MKVRKLKVGDIVKELEEFTFGEVTRVDFDCGFDEVYVTFDTFQIEHCYGSKELELVARVEDRKDNLAELLGKTE